MIDVTPEATPNPNALKFTLDRPSIGGAQPRPSARARDPAESPLGARIFALDGVTNVFMTANFVSVTKEDDADWDELVPLVIDELQAHFGEAS